jgi:ZIP family zinc transporter
MKHGNDVQAWTLTGFSSLACVIGSCFIFIDLVIRRIPGCRAFDLINDKRILVAGMAIGSGVLLFTALNKMLPEALEYLTMVFPQKSASHTVLMGGYLAGVVACMLLNVLLHWLTPESVIHCGGNEHDEEATHGNGHAEDPSNDAHETTPLMAPHGHALRRARSTFTQCKRDSDRGSCAGYSGLCADDGVCCVRTKGQRNTAQPAHRRPRPHTNEEGHHHHVREEKDDFLRIGFQTALAISLHKAPEGLILFLSSHADAALGFRVFLALAIHNLVEGFTIAYPLYLAFENRVKALGVAILLGGLSQPVGALIGFAITRSQGKHKFDERSLQLSYGLLFSATAGFMSFISVVSMLPQAVKNDTSRTNLFGVSFFVGVAIIGFASALRES